MPYVDPNVARKNILQDDHLRRVKSLPDGSPVFSHVEFSILGLCNRKCVFCPRHDPAVYPNVNEFMSLELYQKILNDLSEVQYEGRLSYSGFSEPMLHKDVVKFIALSKEMLPKCIVEIVTNGDQLNAMLLRALFDAGLDTLLVSLYDGPEQIPHFEGMIKESGVASEKVILRKRYLPPEENFGINGISNRAGTVDMKALEMRPLNEPLDHPCYYTHYRMMVDHNGDVLLCPHDWGKKLIAGNLQRENVIEVWTKRLNPIRIRLGKGDRRVAPCNVCDVIGTRQGGEHFKAWQTFYQEKGMAL